MLLQVNLNYVNKTKVIILKDYMTNQKKRSLVLITESQEIYY